MSDPFLIEGPVRVAFSGGRTSAYMLRRILDAHQGTLPDDVIVTFANTGIEREETLGFVRDCQERWDVPIRWLEYRREPFNSDHYEGNSTRSKKGLPTTVEVNYETASRKAEPFLQMVSWMKSYREHVKGLDPILPNPAQRICTDQLKIKTMDRFMEQLGYTEFDTVLGIRADEPKRLKHDETKNGAALHPLARAGVTKADVLAYWASSPFDLQLDPGGDLGNCTLCFMKARHKVVSVMRQTREFDGPWLEMEKMTGATFRKDRSYTELRRLIDAGLPIKGVDDEATGDCFCGDGS